MNSNEISKKQKELDSLAKLEGEIEFWLARDVMEFFGYNNWRNFEVAIKRAISSVEATDIPAKYHFAEANKMVSVGSGATRSIKDYKLTRYACYLIAQNGDPRKEEIAFAQSYFALQTRKQELIEERMSNISRLAQRERLTAAEVRLSKNIYERGVDDRGFGRIRSKGDKALFGGYNTSQMKNKLGINKNRPLADFLPNVTIAAKQLATEITNFNVEEQEMFGEEPISNEHVQNNESIRRTLLDRGIKPEELPPSEDIKKVKRSVERENKKLQDTAERFNLGDEN